MKFITDMFLQLGLSQFEAVSFIKLLLAVIFGGLIGLEREMKGRPAGLKTFSLVCMGSTLAMITNEFITSNLAFSSGDSARMAAQVISGIGFLGAGTIMVTGTNQVKGLTTAAALWVTASIGISIGAGFYFGGIAGLIILYSSSAIYRIIDETIMENSRIIKICVEVISEECMLELFDYLKNQKIRVLTLQRKPESIWYSNDTCAMIEMDLGKKQKHQNIIDNIKKISGIRYVEKI